MTSKVGYGAARTPKTYRQHWEINEKYVNEVLWKSINHVGEKKIGRSDMSINQN